jgi:hypothetical protein
MSNKITDKDIYENSTIIYSNEKENIDYIELVENLHKKLKKISIDAKLKKDILNDVKIIKNRLKFISNIGKNYCDKELLISSFAITTYKNTGKYPSTRSDFDRKYMECPRALKDLFSDNVYGNPIGIPILFVLPISKSKFMTYAEKLKECSERSIDNRLIFGPYRLDAVYRDNTIIRSIFSGIKYKLIMTHTKSNKSILCYLSSNDRECSIVRTNTIDYSGEDIFRTLVDLTHRKATLTENLTKDIIKLKGDMLRESRTHIWGTILHVLDKEIKCYDQGYKYLDIGSNKMLKYDFEYVEPCSITTYDPPYLKLYLACNHTLSIMALYGLIYHGKLDSSESILCPYCKKNLIPKLVNCIPDDEIDKYKIKTYNKNELNSNIEINYTLEKPIFNKKKNNKKINKESNEYIDSVFEKIHKQYEKLELDDIDSYNETDSDVNSDNNNNNNPDNDSDNDMYYGYQDVSESEYQNNILDVQYIVEPATSATYMNSINIDTDDESNID